MEGKRRSGQAKVLAAFGRDKRKPTEGRELMNGKDRLEERGEGGSFRDIY